ncbi:MAG: sulfotransferase [Nocardioides sp.]|nr:sulfotransferase [Nocardioides sp.]
MSFDPTFVFLLSNGRSGSSLIHEVLARHPDVGFISNVEDNFPQLPASIGRQNNAMYRRVPQRFTRKGRLRYAPSEGYRLLRRRVSPAMVASCRDLLGSDATPWLTARFSHLFTERARAQRKPVFVHKFTGWPRSGFIDAALPGARFINIVRDPRAVVSSDLQISWWNGWLGPAAMSSGILSPPDAEAWEASGRSFAVLAALNWRNVVKSFEAARDRVPDGRWLDVRFEDVIADPESQFKEMTVFAGLPADTRFDAALSATVFAPDRVDAYKRDLDHASIAAVEASLARELHEFGYT